jgi:Family of unknown function (DUF5839)
MEAQTMEDNNNTIIAMHIVRTNEDGTLKLRAKRYKWHIPKKLRGKIQKGDIVAVEAKKSNKKPVLVVDVCREEFEETGISYKRVVRVLNKVEQNS